jgi:hypothetical protein
LGERRYSSYSFLTLAPCSVVEILTDVSEKCTASIIRVISKLSMEKLSIGAGWTSRTSGRRQDWSESRPPSPTGPARVVPCPTCSYT